uniref:Trimethylguanosine synthase n=1 Tax=Angiostrongylus cantonensis TaxID=6313 RepID=A0A0K0DJF5_ANGCA
LATEETAVENEKLEEHGAVLGGVDIVSEKNYSSNLDVSFAFDPVKEAHLLAKNAFVAYRNDKEIIKYWYQRYRLFSKLDEGVLMDREGWFSVTPERIAEHIADRMVRQPGILIVDAFAGVGGNSIQLALKGARVIAIDMDPIRLKCARENARVYGVDDRIDFICCDFFHFASKWMNDIGKPVDAVFLSPPWGGPSYLKSTVFDLDDLNPNGFDTFTAARKLSPNIAYFLPRNTALKQVCVRGRCEIEQSCLNKKIKTLTAYYGSLAVHRS